MTTISLAHDDDWRALVAHLPRDYERLAKEHKQLQTQYGNAKIEVDPILRTTKRSS